MFLLPGLVITWYVTETVVPQAFATEIKRYLFARQHPEDGGWGLHIEGHSSVFGTAMNYVVLRLLGASEEEKRMVKARGKLHELGGAVNGPHWAKFWLSVLGVMEWDTVNPVPPELWYVQIRSQEDTILPIPTLDKASSRLGAHRSLALVDSHASSLPPYVLHRLKEVLISSYTFDPETSTGALCSTLLFNFFLLAS